MFITKIALPRRTFLRGMGATLALPLLDAMTPALTAAAAAPKRLGFYYLPNGVGMCLNNGINHWKPKTVGPLVKIGQVNLFAKPDPDLFSASPVSHDLLGQIVPKPHYEDRNDLRPRRIDNCSDARLSGKEFIWILIKVAFPLRMKPDNCSASARTYLNKASK